MISKRNSSHPPKDNEILSQLSTSHYLSQDVFKSPALQFQHIPSFPPQRIAHFAGKCSICRPFGVIMFSSVGQSSVLFSHILVQVVPAVLCLISFKILSAFTSAPQFVMSDINRFKVTPNFPPLWWLRFPVLEKSHEPSPAHKLEIISVLRLTTPPIL